MINQDNHVTTTFAPKKLANAQAALQKTRRAQCDRVSSYRYNAVLSDVKDEFEESKTIQIITGSEPSVTAANIGRRIIQWGKGTNKLEIYRTEIVY